LVITLCDTRKEKRNFSIFPVLKNRAFDRDFVEKRRSKFIQKSKKKKLA